MGRPGFIVVEIKTTFNVQRNSATREVRCVKSSGLNGLAASEMFNPELWNINCEILRDTSELPDGTYKLYYQSADPNRSGYKWVQDTAHAEGGESE